jgi:hypothetical protein
VILGCAVFSWERVSASSARQRYLSHAHIHCLSHTLSPSLSQSLFPPTPPSHTHTHTMAQVTVTFPATRTDARGDAAPSLIDGQQWRAFSVQSTCSQRRNGDRTYRPLSLSNTRAHTYLHPHTQTHKTSLARARSLSLSLSLSHTHKLPL